MNCGYDKDVDPPQFSRSFDLIMHDDTHHVCHNLGKPIDDEAKENIGKRIPHGNVYTGKRIRDTNLGAGIIR